MLKGRDVARRLGQRFILILIPLRTRYVLQQNGFPRVQLELDPIRQKMAGPLFTSGPAIGFILV